MVPSVDLFISKNIYLLFVFRNFFNKHNFLGFVRVILDCQELMDVPEGREYQEEMELKEMLELVGLVQKATKELLLEYQALREAVV